MIAWKPGPSTVGQVGSLTSESRSVSFRSRPPRNLTCRSTPTKSHISHCDVSTRLFEQLAAEQCPIARVSLAHFPLSGFGWLLQQPHAAIAHHPNDTVYMPCEPTGAPHGTHAAESPPTTTDPNGAGLAADHPNAEHQTAASATASVTAGGGCGRVGAPGPLTLLSVPLRLCLSREIPGCCPPALRSPVLRELFFGAGRDLPWEVHLAAALLWACRRHETAIASAAVFASATCHVAEKATHRGSGVGASCGGSGCGSRGLGGRGGSDDDERVFLGFWRRYRSLLPGVGELGTLLFFGEGELRELQDPSLADEARAWQQTVRDVWNQWITAPAYRAEVGEVPLEEWMWAVGCVESRAFGFRAAADGRELNAYVPFFCLANYQPGAPTLHVLRLDPEPGHAAGSGRDPDTRPDPISHRSSDPVAGNGTNSSAGSVCRPTGPSGQPVEGGRDPCPQVCCGGGGGAAAEEGDPWQRLHGSSGGWEPTADMVLIRDGHRRRQCRSTSPPSSSSSSSSFQEPRQPREKEVEDDEEEGEAGRGRERQLFIDYGRKDNKALLNQYGFTLQGNPYDRLDWAGAQLDSSCRMRRDWVYDMAEQLSLEVEAHAEAHASSALSPSPNSAPSTSGSLERRGAAPNPDYDAIGQVSEQVSEAVRIPCGGGRGGASPEEWDPLGLQHGDVDAVRRRFRSAATSIVTACGWRNLRERRLVSLESEERALAALMRWVEDRLSSFPTSAKQDSQLLLVKLPQAEHADAFGASEWWDSGEAVGADGGPTAAAGGACCVHGAGDCAAESAPAGQGVGRKEDAGISGGAAGAGATGRAKRMLVPTPRLRAAVEYRLERKLLLLTGLALLRRLKERCGVQHSPADFQ